MDLPSSRTPFEAIVFDVGGVLVAHDNRFLLDRLASRCDDPTATNRVESIFHDPKWEGGALPISDLHARLRRDLGYAGDWPTFLDDWCCHFAPDASVLSFIRTLSAHQRVIIFSNTNKEHWNHLLARTDLGRYERFLSHEIGLSKPSLASFAHVADNARLTPSRCIFFDDRPENVDSARRAGFHAEVFAGQAWLEDHLGTWQPS